MSYIRRIPLRDTDATGVIYFARIYDYAIETFENILKEKNLPIQYLIDKAPYGFPIVHCEADFLKPLYVDDLITVKLFSIEIKERSFAIQYHILKARQIAAKVLITHVAVLKETHLATPLPQEMRHLLVQLQAADE